MGGVVKFSEAASLALHTMSYLAVAADRLVAVREVAEALEVSENHLAKVMQRLARAGLCQSTRGPKGGFALTRESREIRLIEIYEAIEGPLEVSHCLFPTARCHGDCILGDIVGAANATVRDHLSRTRLSDLIPVFARKLDHGKQLRHPENRSN
jgi:Rrf2 family protein